MINLPAQYLHLTPSAALPDIAIGATFKTIIIAELSTTAEWRFEVGKWLINHGCRFAFAWGEDCSAWDDDIDWADIDLQPAEEQSDEHLVMTTWHEDETLDEVFELAQIFKHPVCDIGNTLLLHIAASKNPESIIAQYAKAASVE